MSYYFWLGREAEAFHTMRRDMEFFAREVRAAFEERCAARLEGEAR